MMSRQWFLLCAASMACASQTPPPAPPPEPVVDEAPRQPVVKCESFPLTDPIAPFDPNADVILTGGGGERPDEYYLSLVFACQHDELDECVSAEKAVVLAEAGELAAQKERASKRRGNGRKAKGRTGKDPSKDKGTSGESPTTDANESGVAPSSAAPDDTGSRIEPGVLVGDGQVQILLDPNGKQPLGVNVNVPEAYAGHRDFVDCIQVAAAQAPYPQYDGPPFIVEFEFELDPGYKVYEEPATFSSAEPVENDGS